MSIYALKPKFQSLLRPLVRALFAAGISANQVTLMACAVSIALGIGLSIDQRPTLFVLIPIWMFVRMAFNAIDGMLAREFGQKSALGAYLNELTDVIADACLYLPFAFLPQFSPLWVGVFIVLAVIVEMTGVIGLMVGASRRYDGPFGKSDRAFAIGALALGVGFELPAQVWQGWIFAALSLLCVWTIVSRVQQGLRESRS
jgi:CDP-diacylglycerol---glycerol-3-phosphate 3-phosphatidyltransferase